MKERVSKYSNKDRYIPTDIEPKWVKRWEDDGIYRTKDVVEGKKNYFALTMFPYPSGDLHIGHWYAFAPADAHARFRRMQGYNVMHPQGFDSFGLPAENAAIENDINPSEWTWSNINNFRRQFRTMGASYDWSREIVTCSPEYYKWNQHFFLKFYENNLAYRASGRANWCPKDKTTLANEQVKDGRCERCGTTVIKKDLKQWFFRITKYADELLNMSKIHWPEKIKLMQKNWIGKSEGVNIQFNIDDFVPGGTIETFTTRIDTIYGVTFIVLAPEHKLVNELVQKKQIEAVSSYIENTNKISEIERTSAERDKTGVSTGAYAVNPLNGEKVPIFIGDYVLSTYGTGAVMGVPAHDQRDFIFAKKYGLDVRIVIEPKNWEGGNLEEAWLGEGLQVNSEKFNGLPNNVAKERISDYIENNKVGHRTTTYHLRDWLISRQRYWGTPIPIIYCVDCKIVPVPEKDLPVLLPDKVEFNQTGKSPLTENSKFLNTVCPKCDKPAERETDTMDTFVDSSWYHFRFMSPKSQFAPFEKDQVKNWAPVHQYMGGAEHAVMHLLYSRFFTKALRDLGYIDIDEPYSNLVNQGMLIKEHKKISKRSNPLNPDPVIKRYGADTLRCYLMFLGPWEQGGDWSDSGINGIHRWLNRCWSLCLRKPESKTNNPDPDEEKNILRVAHLTTKRLIDDMNAFKFNTSIAAMMEFTNELSKVADKGTISKKVWNECINRLLLHLAPMAPYISEEIWQRLGNVGSIHLQNVPEYDSQYLEIENVTLVVQINGRVRDQITVASGITQEDALQIASDSEKIKRFIDDKDIIKTIFVPGRLINLVIK